ncbi:MAG: hypothetical protein HN742_40145 [Lentisphaerae bacterium]|jgi:hypothetical protein|nr:hypothetical protein [Lentisphaerota bacterium]MBT5605112.1 hypothetical protein [Lentisphaerota bacterium]MBT7055994.1 hypothetical protein [Lentisphaerota bacterium]MBT7848147.1 hypothetical protein [Lentisphaerota bacterium]
MLQITAPMHGAVLTQQNDRPASDELAVTVLGTAGVGDPVHVNGVTAVREGTAFRADISLTQRVTDITATTSGIRGAESHSVRVVCDPNPAKRYGFFIDDHAFFLHDIWKNRHPSIFDCFYLDKLRAMHRTYGTRFVLNIFFRNDHDEAEPKFTIDQMPTTYRNEWDDNADWLKLSFHAQSEFPNRPYQYAAPATLAHDYDTVRAEIARFASERTFCPPSVIHWAMVSPGCFKVLRERGMRVFAGAFLRTSSGKLWPQGDDWIRDIGYSVDAERSEYLMRNRRLYDFEHDVMFLKGDVCCNLQTKAAILERLDSRITNPHCGPFVSLASHEQYSFPFYRGYIPDHFERMETAVRWCTDHGYAPAFHHDAFPAEAE